MMRPDAKVEKVYLYPKSVNLRKSIDGLAALVELDIKVAVFDPVLFVFLNRSRNRVKSSIGSATASVFGSSAWNPSVSKPRPTSPMKPSY